MDGTRTHDWYPTFETLRGEFSAIVGELGGQLVDECEMLGCLYARAILPASFEVRRGDAVHAGVAMRASGSGIFIHPYTYRLVCTNGAVRTHAQGTQVFERIDLSSIIASTRQHEVAVVLQGVGDAVRRCASPEIMSASLREMQSSLDIRASAAIERMQLRALILGLPDHGLGGELKASLRPFLAQALTSGFDGDRSAYAFANALTAAAREQENPALRWALEEYGAAVFGATILDASPPRARVWQGVASGPEPGTR